MVDADVSVPSPAHRDIPLLCERACLKEALFVFGVWLIARNIHICPRFHQLDVWSSSKKICMISMKALSTCTTIQKRGVSLKGINFIKFDQL